MGREDIGDQGLGCRAAQLGGRSLTHSSDWDGLHRGLWSLPEFWGRQDAHFLICHLCLSVGFSSFTLTIMGTEVPVLYL